MVKSRPQRLGAALALLASLAIVTASGISPWTSNAGNVYAQAGTSTIVPMHVTASSSYSDYANDPPTFYYLPSYAFDGDPSTFWHPDSISLSFPKWLQADLGQDYKVSQITTTFYDATIHAATAWTVAVSDDPTFASSTTVLTVASNSLQTRTDSIGTPAAGRYVRFTFTAGGSSNFYAPTVNEIVLSGLAAHGVVRPVNATAINSLGSYIANNPFDPQSNTFWQADSSQTSFPKWLQADLGARYKVDEVDLTFYDATTTYIAANYTVAISDDPTFASSTTLETVTGNSSQTRTDTIGSPAAGRYVRFTFTQCASGSAPFYCPTLSRIKIWGTWSHDALTVSSASAINSFSTNTPDKAFDSNTATFWQANSTQTSFPKWLQADLGSAKAVAGLDLNFYTLASPAADYYATGIDVLVSDDSSFSTYATAVHLITNGASTRYFDFAPLTGRYVRFVFNSCNDSATKPFYCPTVTEAKIYGQTPGSLTGAASISVAAAYAKNYYAGDPTIGGIRAVPTNAFDGNAATYWHGNDASGATSVSNPKWLQADLGAAYAVSQLAVSYYDNSTHRGVNYEWQVSDDSTFANYSTVAQVTANAAQTITATIAPVVGRFVRLYVTAGGSSDWFSPAVNDITITGARDEGIPLPPGEGGPGSPPGVAARSSFSDTQTLIQSFDVLFDGQVSASTFADWVASQGVTGVEFHSYMQEHGIIDTKGTAWNSLAGDERLWTSRQVMLDKISALHSRGIKAILYGAPYAASPDFFTKRPNWAARDSAGYPAVFVPLSDPHGQWDGPTTSSSAPYLIYQALNPGANSSYTISGTTYTNYRDYMLDQYTSAMRDYNLDGFRIDFYGSPNTYYSASFSGASDASRDIVDFVKELRTQVKAIGADRFVMVNEIPNADFDRIRSGITAVDASDTQWLELWPGTAETGPTYADLKYQTAYSRMLDADKGVVSNFYPQDSIASHCTGKCMPNGWPLLNIWYNFATPFTAGGSWGAGSVDGHGAFTHVLPFDFTYADSATINLVHDWGVFYQTYGPYYAWGNGVYQFAPAGHSKLVSPTTTSNPNLNTTLTERTDTRTGVRDAAVLHLINYPSPISSTLWFTSSLITPTAVSNLPVTMTIETGRSVGKVWEATSGTTSSPVIITQTLTYTQSGQTLTFTVPSIAYYQMVVVELSGAGTQPGSVSVSAATTSIVTPAYDVGADLLWPSTPITITIFDDLPLTATTPYTMVKLSASSYRMVTATYQLSTSTSYSGTKSYFVTPAANTAITLPVQVHFQGGDLPVRFHLNNYSHITFAWKASGASALSVGFTAINLDDPTQHAAFTYYAGATRSDPYQVQIASSAPSSWTKVSRNLLSDAQSVTGWTHLAIEGLNLGDTGGGGYFDLIQIGP